MLARFYPVLVLVFFSSLPALSPRAQTLPEVEPHSTLSLASGTQPSGFDLVRFYPDTVGDPAGDVNGDGKADLIFRSPDPGADLRTPELGDASPQTFLLFGPAAAVAPDQVVFASLRPVGDVNGDGFADAYSFADDGESVRVYLGSSSGYQEAGPLLSDGAPVALPRLLSRTMTAASGDIDGDGRADLASFGDEELLTVVFGSGETVEVSLPNPESFIRTSPIFLDLDGDGRDEVLYSETRFGRPSSVVSVRLGNGGTFTTESVITSAADFLRASLTTGDADGDGDLDLFVSSASRGAFFVFRREGEGFDAQPYTLIGTYPIVGDLDGDGVDDYSARSLFSGAVAYGPLDFNDADLTASHPQGQIEVVPDLTGAFGAVAEAGSGTSDARVGDLDGDGRFDIYWGVRLVGPFGTYRRGFGHAVVRVEGVDLTVTEAYVDGAEFPRANVRYATSLGDVNDDGVDDLAIVHRDVSYASDPRVEILFGGSPFDPTPDLVLRQSATRDQNGPIAEGPLLVPERVVAGDFNGDGVHDVAVTYGGRSGSPSPGNVLTYYGGATIWLGGAEANDEADWHYSCGTAQSPDCNGSTATIGTGLSSAAAGDISGDGVDDLVFTGSNEWTAALLGGPVLPPASDPLPDDRTSTIRPFSPTGSYPPRLSYGGDMDGDGVGDIVACDAIRGCAVLPGGADGLEADAISLPPQEGLIPALVSAVADFSGDGISDALTTTGYREGGPNIARLYQGGTVPFVFSDYDFMDGLSVVRVEESGRRVFLGEYTALPDLNGDGRAELLVAGGTSFEGIRDAYVVLGGSFEPVVRLVGPNPSIPLGVNNDNVQNEEHSGVGDFDGDGALDLALVQQSDTNDGIEGSRLYIYSLGGVIVASGPGPASGALSVQVTPNPVSRRAVVRFSETRAEGVEVDVFDALGRRVVHRTVPAGVGTDELVLDVGGLPSGTYFLRARTGGDEVSTPFAVAR